MFSCKYDSCRDPWGDCGDPYDASCNIDLRCHNLIDVSNIYFCNSLAILGNHGDFSFSYPGLGPPLINRPILTMTGDIDMDCNNIFDLSRVYFCGGPLARGRNWIGVGSSFDISTNDKFRLTTPGDRRPLRKSDL